MADRSPLHERLVTIACLVVGGVFVWLSLAKLAEPAEFLKSIRSYGTVPEDPPWLLNGLAVWIPVLELLGGIAVVLGVARRGAALTLAGLLAVFTTLIALRGLEIHGAGELAFCAIAFDCGCGTGEVNVCAKLAENTALLLASTWIALGPAEGFGLARLVRGSAG